MTSILYGPFARRDLLEIFPREIHQAIRHAEIDGRIFPMPTSKVYRFLLGMLSLLLWPGVVAAYTDWRTGQAQEQLKAAGFDPGFIDGVLGSQTRNALRRYQASQGLPITGSLDEGSRQAL
jgi:Putative peptidoglycan binding domain